jgi:hypothetical protein
MMNKILYIPFLLLISASVMFADEVRFIAKSKSVVSEGDQFRVSFEVNSKGGSGFKAPSFDGFNVLMGPSTGSSSNIQFINGQMTQSHTTTYTYLLQAVKEGKYVIDAAEITVNGNKYTSNSFSIEVVKGTPPSQTNNNSGNNSNQGVDVSGEELFVRVHTSRSNLYQGEHLIATIKVYTKVNLVGFEEMNFPAFDGFWSQDIETPAQVQLVRENVDGQIYNVGVIAQYVLFPTRSGQLKIDPFELECVVQKRVKQKSNSFFDSFFGGVQNVRKKVYSPEVTINVNALPSNAPASYTGAVGNFTMNTEIDQTQVKANEPISLKIDIKGNGNLKLVEMPEVNFPVDFEVYDPQVSENISTNAAGAVGSKSVEYLIIPRHAGTFKIPSFKFSYFDTKEKKYKVLTSEEYVIDVEKGDGDESVNVVTSNFTKEDVQYIGQDVRFIKTDDIELQPKNVFLISSFKFYLGYIIAFVLFVLLIVWKRKQIKQRANAALMKNKKANTTAKKRLKLAASYMADENRQEFFNEVTKALWGYLSDKLSIQLSELSKENALNILKEKQVDDDMIHRIDQMIELCEFARYAPVTDSSQMQNVYNDAVALITNLENTLR